MQETHKIAILDDHFAIRDGYSSLFKSMENINVDILNTYEYSDDLLKSMEEIAYDLILVDIELKRENGFDACVKILGRNREQKILIFSSHHNKEYILKSHTLKTKGYLFKDALRGEAQK